MQELELFAVTMGPMLSVIKRLEQLCPTGHLQQYKEAISRLEELAR
jgi:hypothetical protein